jgi:hypothetical protein
VNFVEEIFGEGFHDSESKIWEPLKVSWKVISPEWMIPETIGNGQDSEFAYRRSQNRVRKDHGDNHSLQFLTTAKLSVYHLLQMIFCHALSSSISEVVFIKYDIEFDIFELLQRPVGIVFRMLR